jgi:hypothetical protein
MPGDALVADHKTKAQALPPMQVKRAELESTYMSGTPQNPVLI